MNDMNAKPADAEHPLRFRTGSTRCSTRPASTSCVVSSKHNIQYLLGGYRFFFFDYMDAIGAQPLPAALRLREGQAGARRLCRQLDGVLGAASTAASGCRRSKPRRWGTRDAMQLAVEHIAQARRERARIGVERAFLPADAEAALREALPAARDRRRADAARAAARASRRRPSSTLLREASERVVDSMLAVFAGHGPGTTKRELAEALRREEVERGLTSNIA